MKNFILSFALFVLMFSALVSMGQASMILYPGTNVTIENGFHIDVGGPKLLIMDDYVESPSFLQYGNLSFSGGGFAYVEQYSTRDVFHMVSSPMEYEEIEVYLWKYLERYHEYDNTWEFLHLPLNIPIYAGEGFFMYNYTVDPNGLWPSSGDSVVFHGTMNYQDVDLTLSNTDASTMSGWNIIGNPFPVTIEWNGHADWNLNNLEPNMYIYNSVTGTYENWNYNTGGTNPNGGYISSTQGFWVHADDTTGVATSITIPASQRSHENSSFLKSGGIDLDNQLFLTVKDESSLLADKTIIGFLEDATSDFESKYDGSYYPGSDGSLSLYSVTRNVKYVLNELPSFEKHKVVALNFETPELSTYSLSATQIETFPMDVPIFLEDKRDHKFQNLREESVYYFTGSAEDDIDRFAIHFAIPQSYDDLMGSIEIYSFQNRGFVKIPFEINGDIIVYDISGREVKRLKAESGLNEFEINVSQGHFIIQLIAEEAVKSEKVYIK